MRNDLESELRLAFSDRAAAITSEALRYQKPHAKQAGSDHRGLIAAACVVALLAVAGGLGLSMRHNQAPTSPVISPVTANSNSFVGSAWRVTSVKRGGKTVSVPVSQNASDNATIEFQTNGNLLASDTVNDFDGRFTPTARGYLLTEAIQTAVGYGGSPEDSRLIIIGAVGSVASGTYLVTANRTGDTLTLTPPGYQLSLVRTGVARTDFLYGVTSAAPSDYVGSAWLLSRIDAGGMQTEVPASLKATLQFGKDGKISASDGVHFLSGNYKTSPSGFSTSGVGGTANGVNNPDDTQLKVLAAVGGLANVRTSIGLTPHEVYVQVSGATLTLTLNNYQLTYLRTGPAVVHPTVQPSGSRTP